MKEEYQVRENGEKHLKDCDWVPCGGCGGGKVTEELREKYRLKKIQLQREEKLSQLGI